VNLAAAAGKRFEVLTAAGRHTFGALGPAEIVAFTDSAAPHAPNASTEHPEVGLYEWNSILTHSVKAPGFNP
jgi:hypothetical protein